MLALSDIRLSTPDVEGGLKISKSSSIQLLIDSEEIGMLFDQLKPLWIMNGSTPVTHADFCFSRDHFLSLYQTYIELLQKGQHPEHSQFKTAFSSFLTTELEALYAQPVAGERYLLRTLLPVVQLQKHDFFVSEMNNAFHSMVLSKDSIPWGLQFSFPAYYQDPRTSEIAKTRDCPRTERNRALYKRITDWVRHFTVPTPFLLHGVKKFSTMRLGKKCFAWINDHPGLQRRGLQVVKL